MRVVSLGIFFFKLKVKKAAKNRSVSNIHSNTSNRNLTKLFKV